LFIDSGLNATTNRVFSAWVAAESALLRLEYLPSQLSESSDGRQNALPESQLAYNRFDRRMDAPEV
jgi:hypothetical protein